MTYRAVLFDVGDTLWHSGDAPPAAEFRRIGAERAAAYLETKGLPCDDPGLVARAAFDSIETAMKQARATDRIEPDYAAVAREAVAGLGLRVSREQTAGLLDAVYVSGADGGKAAFSGAREALECLRKRGFLLGIVTNRAFGGTRFRDDLKASGLDVGWDSIVVSVEVGVLKPHPAIFERALTELKVKAGEAVMVGNSLLEDVAGAQAVGIAAAWFRSAPDAENVTPDFAFDRIEELLGWDKLKAAARG